MNIFVRFDIKDFLVTIRNGSSSSTNYWWHCAPWHPVKSLQCRWHG